MSTKFAVSHASLSVYSWVAAAPCMANPIAGGIPADCRDHQLDGSADGLNIGDVQACDTAHNTAAVGHKALNLDISVDTDISLYTRAAGALHEVTNATSAAPAAYLLGRNRAAALPHVN